MRQPTMWVAIVLGALAMSAGAQQSGADPTMTAGPFMPSMPYDSAFTDYRPMQEVEIMPTLEKWRMANDTVGNIGGHTGVLKAGQPAGATQPADPHAGHGGMGKNSKTRASATQSSPAATPGAPGAPDAPGKTSPHRGH